MLLSGLKIQELVRKKKIGIKPFNIEQLKSASYTFTLDNIIMIQKPKKVIDARIEDDYYKTIKFSSKGHIIKPGEFGIFFTKEKISLNKKYCCILSTRSHIAQLGLDVAQSSIFAEPDTDNKFVLEITNRGRNPVRLFPGIRIVKGIFLNVN